eukprot:1137710-Prymnesium_polylepis.1
MWDLRKEEETMGIKPSNVPPIDISNFNIPAQTVAPAAPSTALAPAPVSALVPAPAGRAWDEGIDQEVEQLLRTEIGDPNLGVPPVPPPKNQPKLGSSLLFKLPGGVTGELGLQLVRAKEVERRLKLARMKYRSDKRDDKKEQQAGNDFAVASLALTDLQASSFELKKLKLPALHSLERALGVGAGTGRKAASITLLEKKFGNISKAQFQAIVVKINRGVAQSSIVTTTPEHLALPQPPALPAPAPSAPAVDGQQALALRKPRRGSTQSFGASGRTEIVRGRTQGHMASVDAINTPVWT